MKTFGVLLCLVAIGFTLITGYEYDHGVGAGTFVALCIITSLFILANIVWALSLASGIR